MSMMAWGWDVISFASRSRIVVRFGWFLALGWRPAEVFRLAWYRFGLFLYRTSPFSEFIDEFAVWFVYDC